MTAFARRILRTVTAPKELSVSLQRMTMSEEHKDTGDVTVAIPVPPGLDLQPSPCRRVWICSHPRAAGSGSAAIPVTVMVDRGEGWVPADEEPPAGTRFTLYQEDLMLPEIDAAVRIGETWSSSQGFKLGRGWVSEPDEWGIRWALVLQVKGE